MADDQLPDWARDDSEQNLPDWAKDQPAPSPLEKAVEPITSLPSTYQRMVNESVGQMGHGVEQIKTGKPWEIAKGIGNVALGGMGYVASPINAPIHTIVGKPIEENVGQISPTAGHIAGTVAEIGAGLALPVPKLPRGAAAIPEEGTLGVTLSKGQRTGELPAIQREQGALHGNAGPEVQARAQAFADQQAAQVLSARERIAQGFDPFGQTVAANPQEAGKIVSESTRAAAQRAKQDVDAAYGEARAQPGDIHPDVFRGMGNDIKEGLSAGEEPVIIDDHLTPWASKAIQYIDNRVAQLKIQNRAQPRPPLTDTQPTIAGVNLAGVDQMRKNLSTFRRNAFASGNAADGRAAQGVIDAFDNRIDAAIQNGQFTGDQRAVQAWNDARALYADYRQTFTKGKNDPIGAVIEKITGKGNNPAAIPNDVADYLYGASGLNPNSSNVGVVNRLRSVFGEQSPQWSAVRQGLFSRLVEPAEGMTPFGPGKTAQRLNDFLNGNGKDMANAMYSPDERRLLQSYADLMRRLEVPKAGANWSNTASFLGPALKKITTGVSGLIGGYAGHLIAPGLHGFGETAGALGAGKIATELQQAREMRRVARQMPLVAQQMQLWSRAQIRAATEPNAVNQRAVRAAAVSLQKVLGPLGVRLEEQGPSPVQAEPDQQNQQPEVQHKAGGRVDEKQPFHPTHIGARQAPDGHYYLQHEGKYYRVVPRQVAST